MRIGSFNAGRLGSVDDAVSWARAAATAGFDCCWFPQVMGVDALVALAVVAREVPGVDLGTAVVPIQGRHPLPLALSALTVADAAGPGRFTLGLGVTHRVISEGWFGVPYRGIVDACAETVAALAGLFSADRRADLDGRTTTVHAAHTLGADPPPVLLAAMAPRMLALAGAATAGTITWMTGPEVLGREVVPALRSAADAAGRPEPRVVVGIPVCVTDDVLGARERLAGVMARSASMPAYARQLAAEGLDDPCDLVVLGDEATVLAHLERFAAAGMTELCANVVGSPEERVRTEALLVGSARRIASARG